MQDKTDSVSHASTGGAAAAGAVTAGVIGLTGGPIGAAIGALGGAIIGVAAERIMHGYDDDDDDAELEAIASERTMAFGVRSDRDTAK